MQRSVVSTPNRGARAFTLVELLIVMTIAGIIAAGLLYVGVGFISRSSDGESMFDETAAARAWAEGLQYEVVAVNCANMPEGSFVRCSVRVKEQAEPFALVCNVISKSCALAQRH